MMVKGIFTENMAHLLTCQYPTDQPGGSKTIVWTFDVQTLGSAVLEIVAEGIDLGEEDLVTIIDPDGNETKLGSLTSQGFYYSGSYVWRGGRWIRRCNDRHNKYGTDDFVFLL